MTKLCIRGPSYIESPVSVWRFRNIKIQFVRQVVSAGIYITKWCIFVAREDVIKINNQIYGNKVTQHTQ